MEGQPEPPKTEKRGDGEIGVADVTRERQHRGREGEGDNVGEDTDFGGVHASHDGEDRDRGGGVVIEAVHGDGEEVRHLPKNDDEEEEEGGEIELVSDSGVADHWGDGAGDAADGSAVEGFVFPDGINGDVDQKSEEGDEGREEVCLEEEEGAGEEEEKRFDEGMDGWDGSCSERAVAGSSHFLIAMPIEVVVGDTAGGDDEGEAEEGEKKERRVEAAFGGEGKAAGRGHRVAENDAWLGEEVVAPEVQEAIR